MNTLTAHQLTHTDINEITILVARAVKSITANGQRIQSTTILQSGPNWIATIVHTAASAPAPLFHPQPTTTTTPATNGRGAGGEGLYIKLTDLAERTYYHIDSARRLCAEMGITLTRANGSGRPHVLSHTDAQRFAAEHCPGVRIDFNGVLYQLNQDLAVAA
jgi:hypothetical protein